MIIVIGATGFVGMYTVEKLISEGKKVVATGRNQRLGAMLENSRNEQTMPKIRFISTPSFKYHYIHRGGYVNINLGRTRSVFT